MSTGQGVPEVDALRQLDTREDAFSPLNFSGSIPIDKDLNHVSAQTNEHDAGLSELTAPHPTQDIHSSGNLQHQFLEDRLSIVQSQRQSSTGASAPPPPPASKRFTRQEWTTLFITTCWLIFFSIWGALARVGLSHLTTYPGSPLSGVIWANFAGCVVMGFLAEEANIFAVIKPVDADSEEKAEDDLYWSTNKKLIPLYVGMTTGFCGSLTSFSTWMRDSFFALSNTQPVYPRYKGYNVEAVLAEIIATLALSLSGLSFGAHIAIFCSQYTHTIPFHWRKWIDRLGVVLGLGCWIGVVLMSVFIAKWRATCLFAGVFAPLGAWTRYMLSKKLNPLVTWFPMGTFIVNTLGVVVLACGIIAQTAGISGTACAVWQGLDDGFCGAVTTVSTFVVELKALHRKHSYIYGGVTVAIGLSLMVTILGSYTWAHGLERKQCTS